MDWSAMALFPGDLTILYVLLRGSEISHCLFGFSYPPCFPRGPSGSHHAVIFNLGFLVQYIPNGRS